MPLNLRQITEELVDADVEYGYDLPVVVITSNGLVYSIEDIKVESSETGTTVFLKSEET